MQAVSLNISLKDVVLIFSLLILCLISVILMIQVFNSAERSKTQEIHQQEVRNLNEAWQKDRQDFLDRLMAKDLTEAKIAQKISNNSEKKIVSRGANTKRIIDEAQKVGGSE